MMHEKFYNHLPQQIQDYVRKNTRHNRWNKAEKPISAQIVRLIKERASGIRAPEPFGTYKNVESLGYETLLPAMTKAEIPEMQPRVRIGSPQCVFPYDASLLNCSALSFGPMSKNFILAMNKAAHLGSFFQNSGEAGLSPYHFNVDIDIESQAFNMDMFFDDLIQGKFPESKDAGDLVWQLGNGYFGCRQLDGNFDSNQFKLKASLPAVKMIELKLSQGVEPCKQMPVKQVTPGIAKVLGIHWGGQAKLQDQHSRFSSPIELLKFVQELRELSGGKPVGIKIGISHRHYFLAICKAMLKTNVLLDFITVDGMEAGTAASSKAAFGFTGTGLKDSILFVHNALVGTNLRRHIKIIASGKMFTEQDIVSILARGADLCSTARGMLLAVGCDQQRQCYNGNCTRGIATQDPELMRNFDVASNMQKAYDYHRITIQELMELFSIAGVTYPHEIKPFHLQKRVNMAEVLTLDEIYEFLKPGILLSSWPWLIPESFRKPWHLANPTLPFEQMTKTYKPF